MTDFTDDELFNLSVYGSTELIRKWAVKAYLARQKLAKIKQYVDSTDYKTANRGDVTMLTEVVNKLMDLEEILGLD